MSNTEILFKYQRDPHLRLSFGHHGWFGALLILVPYLFLDASNASFYSTLGFVTLYAVCLATVLRSSLESKWAMLASLVGFMSSLCAMMSFATGFTGLVILNCMVSAWLMCDDIDQHIQQHFKYGYRSLVNKIYGKLFYPIVQKIRGV